MKFYDYSAKAMNGREVDFKQYHGKIVIVVNTASKCGLTPQFTELEELYQEYKERGVIILGFPCNQFASQELEKNEDIQSFCSLNYGVSFPMFQRIDVNGKTAHPLYQYLKSQANGIISKEIKWNFTKFLIDRDGNVVKRYGPVVKPSKIRTEIEQLLKEK